MEYYETFTSEEEDYRILQVKLALSEHFDSLFVNAARELQTSTFFTDLLDQITHKAYEAGKRDVVLKPTQNPTRLDSDYPENIWPNPY